MPTTPAHRIGERYLQAWRDRDWDALRLLIAPDVIRITPNGELRSADAYMERARWLGTKLDHLELFALFSTGDQVCLLYDFHAVPPLGKTPTAEYLEVVDGRIAKIQLIFDPRPTAELARELGDRRS
jgi:hypothetical protein